MKRRSSSLMDHSLAFCLLISGDSQYLPFWRIISNAQWLSTSSLLMQYNHDFDYNTSVSNAFFCLLISGDSKYFPFWWIISSKIRNVYQCHHFLVLMQYNHDFDYNPSVWNAFFCLLISGDSQYCPFWRSISSSNILQCNDSQYHRFSYEIHLRLWFISLCLKWYKMRTYFVLVDYIVTDSCF